MISALLLGVAVGASPVTVAAPGLQLKDVDAVEGDAILERFVSQVGTSRQIKVTTQRDVAQLLGLERQRQLLGCDTGGNAACLAELAGSLGVDAVLSGSIVKLGTQFTVTLRVVRARDGASVFSVTERLKTLDAVQDWFDAQVAPTTKDVVKAFAPEGAVVAVAEAPPASPLPWVATAASVAIAGVGLGVFISGKADYAGIFTPSSTQTEIDGYVSAGRVKQPLGVGLMIGGGVALVGSLIWALASMKGDTRAALFLSSDSAFVSVQGRWP